MTGRQVSHYRLEEKLGEGTYGAVYRAVHLYDPELQVAVKIMHGGLSADAQFLEALRRECRHLNRLQHPGIVGFRDLVLGGESPAVVMELLTGQDLHERLAQDWLDVDECLRILDAVLAALAFAHQQGVVHRDIKPSNIGLCENGQVKLVDFGIARADDDSQASQSGQIVGTVDYVAPEAVAGQRAGPAADIYAVGLLTWQMLAGRPACPRGHLAAKVGWHMGVGAPDVRTARPVCPSWLAKLVGRMAVRKLEERPQDAGEAQVLLQELRGELPTAGVERHTAEPSRPPGTVKLGKEALQLEKVRGEAAPGSPATPRFEQPSPLQQRPDGASRPRRRPLPVRPGRNHRTRRGIAQVAGSLVGLLQPALLPRTRRTQM